MNQKYPIKAFDGTNTADVSVLNLPAGSVGANGEIDLGAGVKVYRALLTQTGTDAPVATVLENTLGGTPVWGRSGAGIYPLTLEGCFTANKTFILFSFGQLGDFGGTEPVIAKRVNADEIQLLSMQGADFATDEPIFFQVLVNP